MKVSYNRLWKRLIDENMMKRDLRLKAGLTTNVIAKMGKNEHVLTEVICKICETLGCNVDDIIECIWRVPTAGFAEQNGRNAKLNSR